MNLFAFSGLLIGILFVALGTLTLIKAKKSIHFIWAFFIFSVALWGFGSYKIGTTHDPAVALWWWRIAYVGVIMIPTLLINFIITFLELKRRWLLALAYAFGAIFLIADFYDGVFIRDVSFLFHQFYYLASPPGLYTIFILMFLGLVIYGHVELIKAYKASRGIKRSQIKYFIYSTLPSFVAGALEFLPVYGVALYPYLHLVIALSLFTVTYAIFRYRLMDIRIVIKKALVYFAMAVFAYGIFFIIAWVFEKYFGGVLTADAYLLGSIIAPAFVVVLLRLYVLAEKTTDKYLFFDLYAYRQTIIKLTDQLAKSLDLGKIVNLIVHEIKEAMRLDRAGVLLRKERGTRVKYEVVKAVGFNVHNGINRVGDDFLTRYLEKTRKPLVIDELALISKYSNDPRERNKLDKLAAGMRQLEVSLCLPMIISNRLIGIIVLGSKVSGDAYTSDDLNILSVLTKQAAVAVNNARLHEEVRDFNRTLERKVGEQTKEIRGQKEQLERLLAVEKRAHELEKRANEELRQLDESKTDFMFITQHHLRTPLSINAGIIDLILSGAYGKPSPKLGEVVRKLKESNQKGIEVVNELLDVSSYQLGKDVVHLDKEIDFPALMEETLKDLRNEAKNKGLYLKYEQRGRVPKIPADRTKLKIVLTNVIDNCLKYTAKGGVSIMVKAAGGKLLIDVADTGIGLSADVKKGLFKRVFSRGEEAQKMFVLGKGMGLFLSAKIIEGHHGRIWAESRRDVRGSVFHIELPLVQATTTTKAGASNH